MPYVIASYSETREGETASTLLALGYSGITFVIARSGKKNKTGNS